uniref:Helix-turn-helix DNA binding domain protein n=1 Tax=Micrococcus phage Olihed TaxID=3092209 RepID=A0AAU6R5B8_9CAUD
MNAPEPLQFSEQWWEGVTSRALTAIRREWTVERLERVARTGNPTPVSGDDL